MEARLGDAARRARENAGLRLIDLADTAGVSEATLSRFEHGAHVRERDRIVATYARLCGTTEKVLWRMALEPPEP